MATTKTNTKTAAAAKKGTAKKATAKKTGKAAAPKRNAIADGKPTKATEVHPDVARLNKQLDDSKARMASTAKEKPAKAIKVPTKRAPKSNSYKALAANRFTESKVESPVFVMWNLCNENTDKSRKEVIELAVAKGISFYTARTQYQLWLTAYRNSN